MNWSIWQTGGRRSSYWHLVFRGSEEQARAKFESLVIGLKSGALRLLDAEDKVINRFTAPKRKAG